MSKKHGPEAIIGKLREAEIILAQGGTTGDACRRIAVSVCRAVTKQAIGASALR